MSGKFGVVFMFAGHQCVSVFVVVGATSSTQ